MELKPLILADDVAMAAAYRVECAATQHERPGWVPLGEAARIASWRNEDGWQRQLVGAFEDGVLLGIGTGMTARDTPDTTWVDVSVHPTHQRHGVGRMLVRAVEARSDSATRFVARAYRPSSDDMDTLTAGFAQQLGYSLATRETVVELRLEGADLLAVQPPAGYTITTHVNGVPAELRTQVGVLKGLVDAEAPSGDLQWQPTPVTPEEYVDEIALWQRQGRTAVETIALDPLGEVAAWTCIVTAAPPRPAQVEGTLVLPQHRGRRLGVAVKAACLLATREHAGTERVRTSSDDDNQWMRAINDELGFVPVEFEVLLQKRG